MFIVPLLLFNSYWSREVQESINLKKLNSLLLALKGLPFYNFIVIVKIEKTQSVIESQLSQPAIFRGGRRRGLSKIKIN